MRLSNKNTCSLSASVKAGLYLSLERQTTIKSLAIDLMHKLYVAGKYVSRESRLNPD